MTETLAAQNHSFISISTRLDDDRVLLPDNCKPLWASLIGKKVGQDA